MAFEKGHSALAPEKVTFFNQVVEIQEKVDEIFKKFNTVQSKKLEFKNQKIIAWLLNRSKEAQQTERKLFFERLNVELANEHKHNGTRSLKNEDTSDIIDHNDLKFEQPDYP